MSYKLLIVLFTASIILATTLTFAQNRKANKCSKENANTTCAALCEDYTCLKGSCICSTQLFSNITKRPAARDCRNLARKRKNREKAHKCQLDLEDYRQFFCCIHPRAPNPSTEVPEHNNEETSTQGSTTK